MRDAPALAIDVAPRARSGATRKPQAPQPARGKGPPSLLRRAFARPGVTIAGAAFAAVMTGIVANALLFQKGRHPSPLFQPQQEATVVPPKLAPLPPPRPPSPPEVASLAPPQAIAPEPIAEPAPPAKATPKPAAKHQDAAKPHVDGIGRLLGQASNAHAGTGAIAAKTEPPKHKTASPSKLKPALAAATAAPHN